MNNILFFGTYQRKVDSKGRVSIPAEWRKKTNYFYCCNEKFFVNHIDLIDYFNDINLNDIMPNVKQYNLDTEGRVIFKQEKGKTAILKGCGNYFTIEFGVADNAQNNTQTTQQKKPNIDGNKRPIKLCESLDYYNSNKNKK